ncbi:hypothetical protein SLEP1_g55209 [Rubroshorea leprosula]|uniref:Uncharacterized protein n=1 Tax=Rubroshorea leprosula TaxID=152421 RepID=A0AAV5MEQ5_9ROSI|nr:hypothetical protein SLEP1_g55209 [Rubroshorea leprosula]
MSSLTRVPPRAAAPIPLYGRNYALVSTTMAISRSNQGLGRRRVSLKVVRVLSDGDSYLDMWKKAKDRERKEVEFQRLAGDLADGAADDDNEVRDVEILEEKSEEFKKILNVDKEERDRVQRMQVVDRAAAAIAAARAILKKTVASVKEDTESGTAKTNNLQEGAGTGSSFVSRSGTSKDGTPGPDFWSWTPPPASAGNSDDADDLQMARKPSVYQAPSNPVLEKDRSADILTIPFESTNRNLILPPFQSLIEVNKAEVDKVEVHLPTVDKVSSKEEHDLGVEFSAHAAEAARALQKADLSSPSGVNPDGLRWWRETGIEQRPDGVICRWTMTRGVSADQSVEWQEKYWEASDEFDYKELGSEKSGRDAHGNVWCEFWRESMLQQCGLVHLEKTADKWGKNGKGDEWQEKWWEHYDASGQAEKWAHKWCSIDPNTPLEAGHAHVWHERWGEKYDGHGGSIKYTDKWAERSEGDGWTKWGDKWDEHFDPNGHGVKQGETWWQGNYGERWNRTWGEGHNGSGWVHKYGKSSSGEHWDTHIEQETWYERFPHYGFYHCFDNAAQLREVKKPSEMSEVLAEVNEESNN